ncbi:MAG: MarR family transcriptional regulator [Planctomycetes bacterium]|nr:MarR family transcriptional regulator [Planctomycetota bacterium]
MPTLAHDIKQTVPFAGPEVEAYLNLQRTADQLHRQTVELLKPHGLSSTGYNALRILRGAGPAGLPCSDVGARLVAHDPDITRLADRLAEAGLLVRDRKPGDRRVVILRISQLGLELLARLDPLTVELARRQLSHLGGAGLESLIRLLEQARHPPIASPTSPSPEKP